MATVAVLSEIVPEDCFLRKLPAGLSLKQRMQLDAVRVAASMVGLANYRLLGTALHICRDELAKPSGTSMTALQLDAWSIISHCHTIREVLAFLDFSTPELKTFLAETLEISEVRDAQQHYQEQFSNRSNKKKSTVPLYGAVAWTYAKEPPPISGLYLVTCWSGAMLEPKLSVKMLNPAGQELRLPIGDIRLQAFDYDINLQKVTDQISALVQHLNTRVADLVREELDRLAEKNNVEKSRLHANVAADLFLALWVEVKS